MVSSIPPLLVVLDARFSYEGMLRAAFEHHRVLRAVTKIVFFKVRASCNVSWQGRKKWRED